MISAAELVNSLGNFVGPFKTLLITQVLGFSAGQAGMIVTAVYVFMYIPGALMGGKLADHYGRKNMLMLSLSGRAVCYATCAFTSQPWTVIVLMGIAVFFMAASMPIMSSIMMDITTPENRKASFSLEYLGHNIGFALGPMIAGFMFNNYLQWVFLGDALTTTLMVGMILIMIPETRPSNSVMEASMTEDGDERAEVGSLFSALLRRPILLIFSLTLIMYTLVLGQNSFSLPIYLNEIFGRQGPQYYGLVMTANGLGVVLLTTIITSITLRIDPILSVALAGGMLAVGFGSLFFFSRLLFFLLSAVIWTVGEILLVTNSSVLIANHAPMSHRGRFGAVIPLVTGIGYALGPAIIGRYIDVVGTVLVWPLLAFIALIGAGFMILLFIRQRTILFNKKKLLRMTDLQSAGE